MWKALPMKSATERVTHAAPRLHALAPLSPFIGRLSELALVRRRLKSANVRLLTLIGPGGVGKTRLALKVTRDPRDPRDTARASLFVPLDALTDPDQVLPTIARLLGLPEDDRTPLDRLTAALAERRLILVLDSFEHVLAAAEDVSDLLAACPGLTALVTSRAALAITGEHVFPVPPLDLPRPSDHITASQVLEAAGTALFVARAQAADSTFALTAANAAAVATICHRLDGLPLAIELAAARMTTLSPAAMLARGGPVLDQLSGGPIDVRPRHLTMRDTIRWSYDLLPSGYQTLFRRLAACIGGFPLETVDFFVQGWNPEVGYPPHGDPHTEGDWWRAYQRTAEGRPDVTGQPTLPPLAIEPVDALAALIGVSLVQRIDGPNGEPRFRLLDTIREFGVEQLAANRETDAVSHAHAVWTMGYIERGGFALWTTDAPPWFGRVEAELPNLRAALGWALAQGPTGTELAMRLAEPPWLFWQSRGLVAEGRAWIEAALAMPGGTPAVRAKALNLASLLAWVQGDLDRAEGAAHEAMDFWRTTTNNFGPGRALQLLALSAWSRGDFPRLVTLTEQALVYYRAGNGPAGESLCLVMLAIVAQGMGDHVRALALLDEAGVRAAVDGFAWGIASAHYYAGEVLRTQDDTSASAKRYGAAIRVYAAQPDPWGTGASIAGVACLLAARGEDAWAARLFGAAHGLCATAGAFLPTIDPAAQEGHRAAIRATLGAERYAATFAAGRALSLATAVTDAQGAIRHLARSRVATKVVTKSDRVRAAGLSPRQAEVATLVAAGSSDREIGDALSISRRTVQKHVEAVFLKLGITRRAQLGSLDLHRGGATRPDTEGV